MRNQYLPWMMCAAIAGVGAPALASGSDARSANAIVETHDNYFKDLATATPPRTSPPARRSTSSRRRCSTNPTPHNVAFRDGPQPTVVQPDEAVARRHRSAGQRRRPADAGHTSCRRAGRATARSTRPARTSSSARLHGGMDGTVIVSGTATPTPRRRRPRRPRRRHHGHARDRHATPTATPRDATATATATPTAPPRDRDRDGDRDATATPRRRRPRPPRRRSPTRARADRRPAGAHRDADPGAAKPKPKLSAATFKRSTRTVSRLRHARRERQGPDRAQLPQRQQGRARRRSR